MGPYRHLVRDGVLPPVQEPHNLLTSHSITLQVVTPLLEELTAARDRTFTAPVTEIRPKPGEDAPELPAGPGDVRTLDVLGGEHRAGVLDKPINVVDLVHLVRRPMDTA